MLNFEESNFPVPNRTHACVCACVEMLSSYFFYLHLVESNESSISHIFRVSRVSRVGREREIKNERNIDSHWKRKPSQSNPSTQHFEFSYAQTLLYAFLCITFNNLFQFFFFSLFAVAVRFQFSIG